MPDKQRLLATAIAVACSTIMAMPAVFSEQTAAAQQPELCELKIEGHSILSLTLIKMSDASGEVSNRLAGQRYMRPGASLRLPEGRYRVASVELEGGYESSNRFAGEEQWFELSRDRPYQLVIGAPLSPSAAVTRHGKFLEMDYELVDAAGRKYSVTNQIAPSPEPPQFTVYQNGRMLGSDSFAYG